MSVSGRKNWVIVFVVQMICVVQTEPTSLVLKLVGSKALERSLGCNGHEYGEGHWAMGKVEGRSACSGDLGLSVVGLQFLLTAKHTEHFPSSSKVSADGMEGAIIGFGSCLDLHVHKTHRRVWWGRWLSAAVRTLRNNALWTYVAWGS